MEAFVSNRIIYFIFTGAQVALATWTCCLLIFSVLQKNNRYVGFILGSKSVTITCLITGIAVTIYDILATNYLQALALLAITALWFVLDRERAS